MSQLLKISEALSLALHGAAMLAAKPKRAQSVPHIAQALGVSEAHLSKVFQRLTKAGLVRATRGPTGGFTLTRPPQQVPLVDIYRAIEGPLPSNHCLLSTPVCQGHCLLGTLLTDIDQQVRRYFTETHLSDLVQRMND